MTCNKHDSGFAQEFPKPRGGFEIPDCSHGHAKLVAMSRGRNMLPHIPQTVQDGQPFCEAVSVALLADFVSSDTYERTLAPQPPLLVPHLTELG